MEKLKRTKGIGQFLLFLLFVSISVALLFYNGLLIPSTTQGLPAMYLGVILFVFGWGYFIDQIGLNTN